MANLQCPDCGNDMNFLSFIKAPTPWHMKCHRCGLKLKQDKFRWSCTLVAACFGGVLGAVSAHLSIASESLAIGVATFIAGLVLFEVTGFKLLPKLGIGLKPRNA
jgi:uncharacterized protein (DUF983 family)